MGSESKCLLLQGHLVRQVVVRIGERLRLIVFTGVNARLYLSQLSGVFRELVDDLGDGAYRFRALLLHADQDLYHKSDLGVK